MCTYTYGNRNRLTAANVGALAYTYSYNAREQLVARVQASPATTTHFNHDIFGNVIDETAGGGATGTNGTTREYIWLPETEIAPTAASRTQMDRPLAVVSAANTASPALYYVHVDHLNRPIMMTDGTKATVWAATWLPWGSPYTITGTATLDARFPGQWFQLETGLHYNWHRHYDPTIGRYTQPDPLGFVDGPSVFGYAGGSPLTKHDYLGLADTSGLGSLFDKLGRKVCPYVPQPPGDCNPLDQLQLQDEVDAACSKPRKCRTVAFFPIFSTAQMRDLQANALACGLARSKLNNKCFRDGDKDHRDQEIDAFDAYAECGRLLGQN